MTNTHEWRIGKAPVFLTLFFIALIVLIILLAIITIQYFVLKNKQSNLDGCKTELANIKQGDINFFCNIVCEARNLTCSGVGEYNNHVTFRCV